MSKHMLMTLRNLVDGRTSGFHFGTLEALVKRGLAEKYKAQYGWAFRATESGTRAVQEAA